ncbi:MAG: DUF2846 domain-containing protein [Methylomonas sp.]|uniref:hypothetical protein n=1 Tax=Methylomonas sp. TaxID=418 RepID=UPI0025E970DE|nr:hypothetical protein [Methylomonas sp.]MCK9605122.1 DUF2846 domain-containing protein [Methylomonas sp.]
MLNIAIKRIIIIGLSLLMVACAASGQLSPTQKDSDAKKFYHVVGKARIYVIRRGGFGGSGALTHIMINGRLASTVGPNNYFMFDVVTGNYIFNVLGLAFQGGQPHQFEVSAEKNYFIEVKHLEGTFKLLSTEEGEQAVNDAKRVEINIDPNHI